MERADKSNPVEREPGRKRSDHPAWGDFERAWNDWTTDRNGCVRCGTGVIGRRPSMHDEGPGDHVTLMNESGELTESYKFHVEQLSPKFIEEHAPLYKDHCQEVGWFKQDDPDMAWGDYLALSKAGMLRIFTVRGADHSLIGYGIMFVRFNMHYSAVKVAYCDMIYIKPEFRGGTGEKFVEYIDGHLKEERVHAVVHHAKKYYDFGSMLKRLEYEHVENIYIRRLN